MNEGRREKEGKECTCIEGKVNTLYSYQRKERTKEGRKEGANERRKEEERRKEMSVVISEDW